MSSPPPAIPILRTLPPPAIPLTDAELPPPLLPIRDTTIGRRNLDDIPALTDLPTLMQNMDEWKPDQYKGRIQALEAQLQLDTKKYSSKHMLELYIDKFAYIAMNDARKMQKSLKEAGLTTNSQKEIDAIVMSFVRDLEEVKSKNLTPAVSRQLISVLDDKAKLQISNIENPTGFSSAMNKLYMSIFKIFAHQGIQGVFTLGKILHKHKAMVASVADKTYNTAYYIISAYLFSTLSSFLLFILNPATYMSEIAPGIANITEIQGGLRRKLRTHKRKQSNKHKRKQTKRRY